MNLFIEAQQKLEMEAPKHQLFYAHGCAFNQSRTIFIIPKLLPQADNVTYDLFKNNSCINSSTDLGYIIRQVRDGVGKVPLTTLLANASYVLLRDTNLNLLKLLPIFLMEKSDDGSFTIISDFTYSFDSDGFGKRSGVHIQSLFCDLPSALDYLCLSHSKTELVFRDSSETVKVDLRGFANMEKHIIAFKHPKSDGYISLIKSGQGVAYQGHELVKVLVKL
jgi:hypothetical protein